MSPSPPASRPAVVDSSGRAVAKGKTALGGGFSLNFTPAGFAGKRLTAAGADGATPIAPDEMRYYLEILKAPGGGAASPQPITVDVENVPAGRLDLPLRCGRFPISCDGEQRSPSQRKSRLNSGCAAVEAAGQLQISFTCRIRHRRRRKLQRRRRGQIQISPALPR